MVKAHRGAPCGPLPAFPQLVASLRPAQVAAQALARSRSAGTIKAMHDEPLRRLHAKLRRDAPGSWLARVYNARRDFDDAGRLQACGEPLQSTSSRPDLALRTAVEAVCNGELAWVYVSIEPELLTLKQRIAVDDIVHGRPCTYNDLEGVLDSSDAMHLAKQCRQYRPELLTLVLACDLDGVWTATTVDTRDPDAYASRCILEAATQALEGAGLRRPVNLGIVFAAEDLTLNRALDRLLEHRQAARAKLTCDRLFDAFGSNERNAVERALEAVQGSELHRELDLAGLLDLFEFWRLPDYAVPKR